MESSISAAIDLPLSPDDLTTTMGDRLVSLREDILESSRPDDEEDEAEEEALGEVSKTGGFPPSEEIDRRDVLGSAASALGDLTTRGDGGALVD